MILMTIPVLVACMFAGLLVAALGVYVLIQIRAVIATQLLIGVQVDEIYRMADGRLTTVMEELKLSVDQVAILRGVVATMVQERDRKILGGH